MKTLQKFSGLKARTSAALTALALAIMSPMAMATATFDTSAITTKITTYAGYALVILLAFAAAVWGLHAAGLIGKRR